LSRLIESQLYSIVVENLSKQRAKLKSGEIDRDRKDLVKERIFRKAKLLLHLTTNYVELERFVNAMVLGGSV